MKPGVDPTFVQQQIESQTRYIAQTPKQFEDMTSKYILEKTGILVNFGMAIALGFVIGMIVTGQTIFNFTLDNLRYFASLKAMGTSSFMLIRMVLFQVTFVTFLSYGIGIGVAAIAGYFIRKTDLAFLMPWQVLVYTLVAMLVVGFASGILSLVKVLRLEPGVVFKT